VKFYYFWANDAESVKIHQLSHGRYRGYWIFSLPG